ncbi:MAG: flagellar basal body-associated FliL family protein [Pirellulales bacterium]
MSDNTKKMNKDASAQAPAGEPAKRPRFRRIKIIAFVLGVMFAECAVAYLFVGAGEATAHADAGSTGDAHHADDNHHDNHGGAEHSSAGGTEGIEVPLGEFNVTSFQPQANSTLRISFQLYATTSLDDEYELKKMLEENKHRVREQILIIARSATIEDLTDPMLTLIKRKVSEKVNRLIGKPLVRGAVFSDFSYFEQ